MPEGYINNAQRTKDVAFTPSSYTGNVSATTTVTGQSAALATGVKKGAGQVRIRNLDATNYGLVAFGTSASDAESNASTGVAIEAGAVEIIGVPSAATHVAYLGDTGTVVLNITQGV